MNYIHQEQNSKRRNALYKRTNGLISKAASLAVKCDQHILLSVWDSNVRKLTLFATNANFDENKVLEKLKDPDAAVTHIKPEMLEGDMDEID